ncbi:hypothetical protein Raf01_94360 [Rugosimonospora africana]|uniref:Uncharacterized protein n=1 Tax=Rugosimonospora africana TaxID=556532 RepID=A0A8J3VWU8_9ACTN|nr:hypothetical protein Raf01_94360 [Rugosimonospora africana]
MRILLVGPAPTGSAAKERRSAAMVESRGQAGRGAFGADFAPGIAITADEP